MKGAIYFILIILLYCCAFSHKAEAQSKMIRKTIKPVITPQIAPIAPPKIATLETVPGAPPPPPPSVYEIKKPEISKGIFGWRVNADLGSGYTFGSGSALSAAGKIMFSDPYKLGSRFGLAEDAFEYKAGLGLMLGGDANKLSMFSLPFLAEAIVYLKEGSLFGFDPYLGGGFNLNLIGTNSTLGGMGWQIFGGIAVDFFGSEAGKTGISIGYHSIKVGSIRNLEGLTISIGHPIIL